MIDLALRHARRSDHALYHHCAFVVKHGRIVGIGVNNGWTHAEEQVIRSCSPAMLRGSTLYSFRVNKHNKLRLAKPCRVRPDGRPTCSNLIRGTGIKWVVYSGPDGELVRERV